MKITQDWLETCPSASNEGIKYHILSTFILQFQIQNIWANGWYAFHTKLIKDVWPRQCSCAGCPGIKSQWGREPDYPHPSRLAMRPIQSPYTGYWIPLPGVGQLGCGVDHPPPSSAKVKGRLELYLFSSTGPSCSVLFCGELYFTLFYL